MEMWDVLAGIEPAEWALSLTDSPITGDLRWNGPPNSTGIEIATATSDRRPSTTEVREAWRERVGDNTSRGLVLVVFYSKGGQQQAATCGTEGDQPKVVFDLDPSVVQRICEATLRQPGRVEALKFLAVNELEEQTELPGIRNVGLFATNELVNGVPNRADWPDACQTGRQIQGNSGLPLLSALGFEVQSESLNTQVLVSSGTQTAVAVVLDEGEEFETPAQRLELVSPVTHGLAAADRLGLKWLLLVRGSTLRLHPAQPDIGVGRRGRSATFFEANLDLIDDNQIGLVSLCFNSEALPPRGTVDQILSSSEEFVSGLGERLRDRIYFDAVPGLAKVIAAKNNDLSPQGLKNAYAQTMTVLFRLLFVAYAEDKDLLPYRSNGNYSDHSITNLAKQLAAQRIADEPFDQYGTDLWDDIQVLWTAISQGREDWDVPAYGGTLFSEAADINPEGAALASYRLTNQEFGPTLSAMTVDCDHDGLIGPVDFRSLSVREFGTIYETLLESEITVSPYDLTESSGGELVRAESGDAISVSAGEIWFHNRSGERKAQGSYFTKPFAVEHLIREALIPALDKHLESVYELLSAGDEAAAAKKMFQFRCADIAMGSGHFLVTAIDHLEAAFTRFLAETPIPQVNREISQLAEAAKSSLGNLSSRYEIDSTQILRRLIARRCVFGCDINPISVELSRLAIWIHTFVPGLPLGFLDRNLVAGNGLTGFGRLEEIDKFLGDGNIFNHFVAEQIQQAQSALERLSNLNDQTTQDVEAARVANDEARDALAPIGQLFDLLALKRGGLLDIDTFELLDTALVESHHGSDAVSELLAEMSPIHFPLTFPEILAAAEGGFDCILGNPPWEIVKAEKQKWWGRLLPGIRSLPNKEMNARIKEAEKADPAAVAEYEDFVALRKQLALYLKKSHSNLGSGDVDLYRVFAWRFWNLLRKRGTLGAVLPYTALSDEGMGAWRKAFLEKGEILEITQLLNNRKWVFEGLHAQEPVALLSLRKAETQVPEFPMQGLYDSRDAYEVGSQTVSGKISIHSILNWTTETAIPLLPLSAGADAVALFAKIAAHPTIASGQHSFTVRPLAELHATADKPVMTFPDTGDAAPNNRPEGDWAPVYKGESFNLWEPDTGTYYAWASVEALESHLFEKRKNQARIKTSAYFDLSEEIISDRKTLNFRSCRLTHRKIARATDRRTMIAALVPPNTTCQDGAPLLVFREGTKHDEAYLLGILSSTILDWQMRRWVEKNVTFGIFGRLTIPVGTDAPAQKERVAEIAGRLAAVDDRYREWADAVGVPVGSVGSASEKSGLLAELDAVAAHLYGLDSTDLEVIWETFHTTNDHLPNLETVKSYFEEWQQ